MTRQVELVVRTSAHAPAERLEFWRTTLCSAFVPLEAEAGTGPVDATLRVVDAGVVRFNQVHGGSQVVRRTPALIRRDDPELVKVGVQVSGRGLLAQDGREVTLEPGDFTLYHTRRPFQLAFAGPFEMLVMMFPRSAIEVSARSLMKANALSLGGRDGVGELVASFLLGLNRRLNRLSPDMTQHLAQAALDMLAGVVDETVGVVRPADPRPLMTQATTYIEENLASPDLGPAEVAAAVHVSTRYLHKVFAQHGETVAGWIRRCRLERCRRDLVDPCLRDEPVSSVAARWGLTGAANFSRTFRSAYGASPREYRLSAVGAIPRAG